MAKVHLENDLKPDAKRRVLVFSVMELSTQAQLAIHSYGRIHPTLPTDTDIAYTAIHSILAHAGIASKILWSAKTKKYCGKFPADVLRIDKSWMLADRSFRDALEHIDERLPKWISAMQPGDLLADYNVIPKNSVRGLDTARPVLLRNYDPETQTFTLYGQDLNIGALMAEITTLQSRCNSLLDIPSLST